MYITTIWRVKMISFCWLSFEDEDIQVIKYGGVNIHKDLSLKAFVNNKAVSLRSLKNSTPPNLNQSRQLLKY